MRVEAAADDRAPARARRRPPARPRGPAPTWKSIARSRWPKASGCCGAIACSSAIKRQRRVLVATPRRSAAPGAAGRSGRRAAGRDRGVLEVLAAGDQARVVVGDGEEAAALRVVEALRIVSASSTARVNHSLVEGRLVQRQVRLEQVRVVLEVGRMLGPAAVERRAAAARTDRAARARRTRRTSPRPPGSPRAPAPRPRRPAPRSSARSSASGACRPARAAPATHAPPADPP